MASLFFGAASPLSNFYACSFEFDGHVWSSSEQAFMARKAVEFGDDEMLQQIRQAKKPLEAKRLGRKVRGYDDERWCAARERHMFEVLLAKFSQHAESRAALLATGTTRIAEASPRDRVWGIGMGASNPDAQDPSKWKGRNLLGKTLEEVRARLVETESQSDSVEAKRARVQGE